MVELSLKTQEYKYCLKSNEMVYKYAELKMGKKDKSVKK